MSRNTLADPDLTRAMQAVERWRKYPGTSSSHYQKWVVALANEIERLRRGEFICSRCHLRKDGESDDVITF